MSAGKIIGYIIAAIWAAFSPEGETGWILVGVISVGIGLGIIGLIKFRQPKPAQSPQEIIQKIDLSGEIEMETLKCQKCGGELQKDSITVNAPTVAPRTNWSRNQSGNVES